jgi:hypothetical protein
VFGCLRLRESHHAGPHVKCANFLIFPGIEIVGALIFDFDGVIADREAIANTVLAETVTRLGHSTTLDEALTVVGLCAASHIRDAHDLKLRDAGAVHLAHSWSDVERLALHFFNGYDARPLVVSCRRERRLVPCRGASSDTLVWGRMS